MFDSRYFRYNFDLGYRRNLTKTDITCASTNNGSIDITVTGGNAPFIFDWNDNSLDTMEDPNGLSAGVYTVTITDNTSCTVELATTLLNPDPSISASISAIDVGCLGASDGELDLTIIGGNAPYSYDWSVDVLDGIEDHTCKAIGTYSVTVTDINGCSTIASATINDSGITCPTSNIALVDQRGPAFTYPQFDTLNICQLNGDTLNLLINPDNECLDNVTFTIDFPTGMFWDGYAETSPAGFITGNDGGHGFRHFYFDQCKRTYRIIHYSECGL